MFCIEKVNRANTFISLSKEKYRFKGKSVLSPKTWMRKISNKFLRTLALVGKEDCKLYKLADNTP